MLPLTTAQASFCLLTGLCFVTLIIWMLILHSYFSKFCLAAIKSYCAKLSNASFATLSLSSPGVSAQAGNRRPPQCLDHLQRQEQRVLRLADPDGEQGVPQWRPEHRGNGGEAEEGTRACKL